MFKLLYTWTNVGRICGNRNDQDELKRWEKVTKKIHEKQKQQHKLIDQIDYAYAVHSE